MPTTGIVVGLIIFVAMLLSVPVIAAGVWLSTLPDNACVGLLQWPVIILGMLILAVALAGFVGALWRVHWLLFLHLAAMLAVVLLLTALVVFLYAVTSGGGSGHVASGRAYREYRLGDYSGWLRRRVQSSPRWERISSCLRSTSSCEKLDQKYRVSEDFFAATISPLQSGCCKPPTDCGLTFVNPTYWTGPTDPAGAYEDCTLWSNNQTQLCYACNSCKAGLLENLKREWRRAGLILVLVLLLLIAGYSTVCYVLRNAHRDSRSPSTGKVRVVFGKQQEQQED